MRGIQGIVLNSLFAGFALALPAQQPGGVPKPDVQVEGGEPVPVRVPGANDAQQEMIELFGKVERNLRAIDALLDDAGSNKNTKRLADAKEAGIGDLLQRSLETGRSVREDIDRILELAAQMGQQQQSGGQSQGQGSPDSKGGESGLLDRGPQRSQREETPEGPNGEKPEGQDPQKPQSGAPKDPGESQDDDPQNAAAGEPPAGATDVNTKPAHAGDRWGDLPVHVQDIFRTEGDRHMPARYRDWIDAYYRKLAERSGRR